MNFINSWQISDFEKLNNINDYFSDMKMRIKYLNINPKFASKFIYIWENTLKNITKPNIYFPNIKYIPEWNLNYREHFTLVHEIKHLNISNYEILFNINNIHALIYQYLPK